MLKQNSTNNSIEFLTKAFSKLKGPKMAAIEALVEQITHLQTQIVTINEQLAATVRQPTVVEYQEVQVAVCDVREISLDMFKTLPEFNGDRNKYVAWRTAAKNVMKILIGHTNKPKYFEALNIVRNKITGTASETLTNYNTVFNFDAIIDRLDFTYADKRPCYIIEQEMMVLQQKNLTIEEFYDEVNKKMNSLINKINMTHRETNIAQAMVRDASEKALRTFVTGLRGSLGQILYASNPSTLPDAYAKIQTIVNDQERIKFANQFNHTPNMKSEPTRINPNFVSKQVKQFPNQQQSNFKPIQSQARPNFNQFSKPIPMEIDRSSMNVNVGTADKRPHSAQVSNQFNPRKLQRINQIQVIENQQKEMYEATVPEAFENETDESENDEAGETSSVFLGN